MSIIQFKQANCTNCCKCIRNCPVKAISYKNQQASIIEEECILCGQCLLICPQNAKSINSDIYKVREYISKKEKVYVSLAPSFVSAFPNASPSKLISALKKLGFTHIEETSIGAALVSIEYEKLIKEGKMRNIITTACPTIISLIEKHYPSLIDDMAPVVSPMIAHAKTMRQVYGSRIKVVFIGPCISKIDECNDLQNAGVVNAVLTFEEIEKWLKEENIKIENEEAEEIKGPKNNMARFYPAPGGIIKTINKEERKKYKCVSIDGLDRCINMLEYIKNGEIDSHFIEMSACVGSCLGGPCIKSEKLNFYNSKDKLIDYIRKNLKDCNISVSENAQPSLKKAFTDKSKDMIIPDDKTIRQILSKIGKFTESSELNCGACGYSTCKEKAIAVYNNKAELEMCIPYMRERAESISNIVIESTPNAILALNDDLYIQEFNKAAETMFKADLKNVKGKYIYEFIDCTDFINVKETEIDILNKKNIYEKYGLTVIQSTLYIKKQRLIIAIIKDITNEEKQKEQMYKMQSDTVEIAQKVIDKQMRVAQEIASLLGETTAETKIALTKLKKLILSDSGDEK